VEQITDTEASECFVEYVSVYNREGETTQNFKKKTSTSKPTQTPKFGPTNTRTVITIYQ